MLVCQVLCIAKCTVCAAAAAAAASAGCVWLQVSTLCVSGGLLAAGGFTGELVLGRLARSEPGACWGDEDSEYEDEHEDEAGLDEVVEQQHGKQQESGAGSSSCVGVQAAGSSSSAAVAGEYYQQQLQQQQQQQRWVSSYQKLPLWTAAGSSSRFAQGGQSWQAEELRVASSQHAAATQRYVWGWEHQWTGLKPQPQQQQCSSQQGLLQCHQQQAWQQRRGCRRQQQQQQQHEWPSLVRLRHEPGSPQQQDQQCAQDCMQQRHHQQQQQRRQQQQHDDQEVLMGASGPAACEVLHSCRVTQSENGITNGIEIFNSCEWCSAEVSCLWVCSLAPLL
jgi:hypothetical protein